MCTVFAFTQYVREAGLFRNWNQEFLRQSVGLGLSISHLQWLQRPYGLRKKPISTRNPGNCRKTDNQSQTKHLPGLHNAAVVALRNSMQRKTLETTERTL